MTKPARSIILKFPLPAFSSITLRVASEREARLAAPLTPAKTESTVVPLFGQSPHHNKALSLPNYPAQSALDSTMAGHDMRCAMLMLIDQCEKFEISLTDGERADLETCLAFEIGGRKIYQEIRARKICDLKSVGCFTAKPLKLRS